SFLSFVAIAERPALEIAESETFREEEHCDFFLVTGQSCCGRRASLAHFLSLATRFRSLQGELVYAAVDWAAPACLRPACHRSAGGEEAEPHGAAPARGGPVPCAPFGPRACACGRSPCSRV